jgi:hypothetical protein
MGPLVTRSLPGANSALRAPSRSRPASSRAQHRAHRHIGFRPGAERLGQHGLLLLPSIWSTRRPASTIRGSVSVSRGSPAPGASIAITRCRHAGSVTASSVVPPGKNEAVCPSVPIPAPPRRSGRASRRLPPTQPAGFRPHHPGCCKVARSRLPPPGSAKGAGSPAGGWSAHARRAPCARRPALPSPCPTDRLFRQRCEERLRRRAARNRQRRGAAFADRQCQRSRHPVGQRLGQLLAVGRTPSAWYGPFLRQSLSCQVLPSRSISAIAWLGPQVPAV